jgi:hypothetical protein
MMDKISLLVLFDVAAALSSALLLRLYAQILCNSQSEVFKVMAYLGFIVFGIGFPFGLVLFGLNQCLGDVQASPIDIFGESLLDYLYFYG